MSSWRGAQLIERRGNLPFLTMEVPLEGKNENGMIIPIPFPNSGPSGM
jgi:hypothetical protein